MPYDSAGNFTRDYNWVDDRDAGIKIEAARMDGEFDNFAAGMNAVFLRNGVAACTGNLNLGGHTITNLGQGTAAVPALWFTGDATTGLYSPGPGEVTILSGGVAQLSVTPTGVAFGGNLTTTGPIVTTELDIDGLAGTVRPLNFKTSGVLRWQIAASSVAEPGGGANSGSGLVITRYNDTGTAVDNPIQISRANGTVILNGTGGLNVSGAAITIDGARATIRKLLYTTASLARWEARTSNTDETGSNAGSNYVIGRYADDGVTYLGDAFSINRATGGAAIPGSLTVSGNASINGTMTLNNPTFFNAGINIQGAGTGNRTIAFSTTGTNPGVRWFTYVTADGGGGNAGADFIIARYNDAGSGIDNPFTITRSNGLVYVANNFTLGGYASIGNGLGITGGGLSVNTGNLVVGTPTNASTGQIYIQGSQAAYRSLVYQTGNNNRWAIYCSGGSGETGSNAGSDLYIARYNDAGNNIDNPLVISRVNGSVGINVLNAGNENVTNITITGAGNAPTAPKGDNSTSIATTAFVHNEGSQTYFQEQLSGGTYVLGIADAGHNLLCGGANTAVTFPNGSGVPGTSSTFWLSNIGSTDLTLNIPGGTDFRNVLHSGEQVTLSGDGNGYFRTIATGHNNLAYSLGVNGWERTTSGRLDEWGTSGSVPANGSLAVSFPKAFGTLWNITLTPTGSAGSGGMAYYYPFSQTVNGFTIFNAGAGAVSFYWRATGI